MEWKRGRNVSDIDLLDVIQKRVGVTLPGAYLDVVRVSNAAAPHRALFRDGAGRERVFSRLISASTKDSPNLKSALNWVADLNRGYALVPFALDPFGNLLCFNYADAQRYTVAFVDMELQKIDRVADSFEAFMDCLY